MYKNNNKNRSAVRGIIAAKRERERERDIGVIAATSNWHNLYLFHRQLGLHYTLKVSTC